MQQCQEKVGFFLLCGAATKKAFFSTVVLSEVIQAFSVPENAARMEEARESACNDMGKMLQLVLPVATQIQQEVIKAYGFNNEGEGEPFCILKLKMCLVLLFARLEKKCKQFTVKISSSPTAGLPFSFCRKKNCCNPPGFEMIRDELCPKSQP